MSVPEFLQFHLFAAWFIVVTLGRPLSVAAFLVGLVSLFWPRTPLAIRIITLLILVFSMIGASIIESQVGIVRH